MSERERERPDGDDDDGPAEPFPPAQRPPGDFGAEWVDPDDAAEEMQDETEGRS